MLYGVEEIYMPDWLRIEKAECKQEECYDLIGLPGGKTVVRGIETLGDDEEGPGIDEEDGE